MKILELEIENIRGIRHIRLTPNGENMVIWGPNGAGKSAVVDAIDFLFTGQISSLIGAGTAGITLKNHGPHIDQRPMEAFVRAKIKVNGVDEPINLERKMSSPKRLLYPTEYEVRVNPVFEVAARGQNVLSRRQILNYVAAEPSKRATEVQALLNLDEIEDIRKALGKTQRTADSEYKNARIRVEASQQDVQTTLNLTSFSIGGVLDKINKLRKVLGGGPLTELTILPCKAGITAPSARPPPSGINPEMVKSDVNALMELIKPVEPSVSKKDEDLRRLVKELREDEHIRRELASRKLIEMGITLLDEEGACPLCGKSWHPEELRKHLDTRLANAVQATEKQKSIDDLAIAVGSVLETAIDYVGRIEDAVTQLKMLELVGAFHTWKESLQKWLEILSDPLTHYSITTQPTNDIERLLAPKNINEMLQSIKDEATKLIPIVSPEQTAWDTLTRMEAIWEQYIQARYAARSADHFKKRVDASLTAFVDARDDVLTELYDSIESEFSAFYREMHSEDEGSFKASLTPHGAGLLFEADFYGRGMFPPLALHSEGHQDSMGLCLYLALIRRITEGIVNLTVLDDVVMSVDANHRRSFCKLLREQFPDRQFIITTHDKTWSRQLRTEGIVNSKNLIEFRRWSLETGPLLSKDIDFWSEITADLLNNNVPSAAHQLRRGAEYFFEMACDSLCAPIAYRGDYRWELADYLSGAIGAYKKYLKQAKKAAQSWNNQELFEQLNELDTVAKQIITRSQVEQWAINENVHYNRWGDFSEPDFRLVVEAFQDLFGLFRCSSCGGFIYVTHVDRESDSIRCGCGAINWNLRENRTQG
jgi:energy-coupling factor transporter ATP-binding protein EcfA2